MSRDPEDRGVFGPAFPLLGLLAGLLFLAAKWWLGSM